MSKYTNAIRTLAKMNALDAAKAENLLNAHVSEQDGGPGSGNFGHAGRPGKKGGSAPRGGGGGGGSVPKSTGGTGLKEGIIQLSNLSPKKKNAREKIKEALQKWRSGEGKNFNYNEYRKNLEKEPGRGKPMEYIKGETPELMKKAESKKGLGFEDLFKMSTKPELQQGPLDPVTKKPLEPMGKNEVGGMQWGRRDPKDPFRMIPVVTTSGFTGKMFWDDKEAEKIYNRELEKNSKNISEYFKTSGKMKPSDLPEQTGTAPVGQTPTGTFKIDWNGREIKLSEYAKPWLDKIRSGEIKIDPLKKLQEWKERNGVNVSNQEKGQVKVTFNGGELSFNISPKAQEWIDKIKKGEISIDPAQKLKEWKEKLEGKAASAGQAEGNAGDPTGRKISSEHKSVRLKAQKDANMKQADKCFNEAQSPEFANEPEAKKQLELWSNVLSKPQPGRPTPEESQAEIESKLSKISPKLEPYFREVYEKRLRDEPNITNDLCDICDEIGTEMYGLDHRLKSAKDAVDEKTGETHCRAAEKIAEDMAKKGWTYKDAVDNFSDMVRYTQSCTSENLVDNFERTKAALEKKDYKFAKVKNTWDSFSEDNPYRGVNCVVISPNGTRFELQFHTPESVVGKEVQHPWYEEFRSDGVKPERKAELGRKMYNNMKRMAAPKNIGRIANYPPTSYD